MKKKFGLLVMVLVAGTIGLYAAGVSEQEIDAEYATKVYSDKSDWVYEFNQMANKVHNTGQEVVTNSGKYSFQINNFDEYSYRYKVLLDIGVKYRYIDDKTRQQQIAKLREERDKVSAAISAASGLGL
ncbi:hypothetical protein FACS189485_12360 [Spirochaetia bacterium]|nr:hypothetical protein FACS189485_12360 [Spirochaetia bacterium]